MSNFFTTNISRNLQACHIDWLQHELDQAADKPAPASILTKAQRDNLSVVHGGIKHLIPAFANNDGIPEDYGLLIDGAKSQLPSFILHPVPEVHFEAARHAYTTQWEPKSRGFVQQVVLLQWVYRLREDQGHIEGLFEVFTYDAAPDVERLVSRQRGKILPPDPEDPHSVTIEICQKTLLGDNAPEPDKVYKLQISSLTENASEAIYQDEELESHPAGSKYCNPEMCAPTPEELEIAQPKEKIGTQTDVDNKQLDIALRTPGPIALVPAPKANTSNSYSRTNNTTNNNDNRTHYGGHSIHDSIGSLFAPVNIFNLSPPTTAAEFLTLYHNITATLNLPIPSDLPTLASISSSALAPACASLGIPPRTATTSLASIALYDSIILCDDSGSMRSGGRYSILKETVQRLAPIATHLSGAGVSLRFINYTQDTGSSWNNLRGREVLAERLASVRPKGWTPIGTRLRQKVLEPLVLQKARKGTLDRPVLVTIITDGEPTEEDRGTLKKEILKTKAELQTLKNADGDIYGDRAVIFQINYVGNSADSKAYIDELEADPEVGHLIYCNKEKVDDAWRRLKEGSGRNSWLLRLLSGAIWQGMLSANVMGLQGPNELQK